MRLSHNGFAALEQAIYELHDYRDLDQFRREVPAILLKLIPSEYFFWPEFIVDPVTSAQGLTGYVESSPVATPSLIQQINGIIPKHPFTWHLMKGGERTALKVSDFLTQTQFRNSEIYGTYREWGFRYNMGVVINASFGKAACVGLYYSKKDFTEHDRLTLNLLRRHFNRAHRRARLVTSRSAAQPLVAYDLTPRETEIALWVGGGKSNPEIAIILRCSVRTVEKHMEKILKKLGVQNRAAAAVVVAHASGNPFDRPVKTGKRRF